jgi:hypothetical protein
MVEGQVNASKKKRDRAEISWLAFGLEGETGDAKRI